MRLIDNKKVSMKKIKEYCLRHHITKLSLFGSALRNDVLKEAEVLYNETWSIKTAPYARCDRRNYYINILLCERASQERRKSKWNLSKKAL